MSDLTIALNIVARNMGSGVIGSLVRDLGGMSALVDTLGTSLGNSGISLGQFMGGVAGAGAAFAAFYSATKSAVDQSAELEYALAQMDITVQGVSGHTQELTNLVIDLGNNSVYTHTQVVEAFTTLGQHGYTATQILQGMGLASVNLGIALGVDAATGANTLAMAMKMFNVPASDASHYADMLNRAVKDSAVGVDGFTQALSQSGGMANTLGVNFSDYATVVDILSGSMGSGSKAGTSLRYMLSSLINPTNKSMEELSRLGIVTASQTSPAINDLMLKIMGTDTAAARASGTWDGSVKGLENIYVAGQKAGKINLDTSFADWATSSGALNSKLYDSTGHFLGMKNAVDVLQTSLKGMSPQQITEIMTSLFNVRGGQGAMVLTNLKDFDARYKQISADLNQTGTAQANANTLLQTAQGRWQQLGSTMNSFMAQVGGPINDVLKNVYMGINNVVSVMSKDGNIKAFTSVFFVAGTVLAGVALIVGGVLIMAFLGILPIVAAAAAVFAGIVLVAALVAGGFILISTQGQNILKAIKPVTDFISSVFIQTWHNVQGAMAPIDKALSDLSTTARTQLLPAWNQLVTAFKPYIPVLEQIAKVIGIVLGALVAIIASAVIAILIGLLSALLHGFVGLLTGVITFATGFVTALMGMFSFGLDILSGFFRIIGDMFTNNWGRIGHDTLDTLGKLGQDILTIFKGIGIAIGGIVQAFVGTVVGLIGGFVTGVVGFFQGLANTLVGHSIIPDMINAIFTWFGKLPGMIGGIFTGLAKSALSWGADLIGNVIGGITSMAGNLSNAVGNVAGTIKSFLHFSKPDVGPLADADTYGGDFIQLLAGGMVGNLGTLRGAASSVASTLASGVRQPGSDVASAAASAAGGGSGTVVIPVYLDSKLIGQATLDTVKKQLQMSGATRMFR